jgi:hypothetical protein
MPQKPIVRRRQKARRTKQLAQWREKQAQEAPAKEAQAKPAK